MYSFTDDLGPLDEQGFGDRVEPHRRELHLHCYRLLGSFEEAEDVVQEALLRAWRRRETYEGRDVLGCSAKETARLLETTVASVNSALQRARAGLRGSLPEDREAWQPAAAERKLVARYVECSERVDAVGLAELLHADVRFSMPPTPGVWIGRSRVVQGWIDGGFGTEAFGSMRCVLTRANGQPAVAGYVRKPGEAAYEPLAIDVLRVRDGVVTEIVTFDRPVFQHFALPATLSAADGAR